MEGARPVRAPRGTTLTARSWQTEAPLRMLQNNLDPEVAERPDDLVVYGGTGRAARDWRSFDAMVRTLTTLRGRRDDARAVRQAGRRAAHARVGAAGADRQLQPGRRLGHLAGVPPPRAARPHHVRPDDRGLVDLHRHPGHPAGHLRDVRRRRRQAVRRHARRHPHPHRRLRRHGRRPAAGGHAERRGLPRRRRRPDPAAPPRRAPLPRRARRRPRRRHRHLRSRRARAPRLVGRGGRQLRRGAARAAAPRRRRRRRHRPDLRPRPAVLPARGRRARRLGGLRRRQARGVHRPGAGVDGPPRRGHGRLPGRGRRGLRLRQLDPRRGPPRRLRARVRVPRLRARLHPAAVLRGQGPVPLGRALRRPGRHRRHRRGRARPVPRQRPPAPLDPRRAGAGRVPGPARPDLLARPGRAGQGGAAVQRDGRRRARCPRRS